MSHDIFVRFWFRRSLLLTLFAIAACEGDGLQPDSLSPWIQLRAELADGSTNVGQGPFKVSVDGVGRTLDEATLQQLSARLSLRTWPEGTLVSSMVSVGPISTSASAVMEMAPLSVLEDRWYSVQLGAPASGIATSRSFDNGVAGIRVRPGSHARVSRIDFCQGAQDGGKFIVYFSEPVTADSPTDMFTVTQNGQALSCRFDDFRPQELHEFCGTLVRGPVSVALAADRARAAEGTSLEANTWSFDIRTLPTVQSGCTGYVVPW